MRSSYTVFQYEAPTLSASIASSGDTVTVTVPVTNTGTLSGDEVSFLFVSYPSTQRAASLRSSPKELKGFTRTTIAAGQTAMATIPLRVSDLKFWDTPSGRWVGETGAVSVMVGGSSDRLEVPIVLTLH
jgi:beta-glucosidase